MGVTALFAEEYDDEAPAPQAAAEPRAPLLPSREILAALSAIAALVGTRVVLLLTVIFAFVLANTALNSQGALASLPLGLFLIFGFLPVVHLSSTRKM